MIVTVFRSRLKPEHAEEYAAEAQRTYELARAMPGFISVNSYAADDGERVTIVEFEDEATHDAWRAHPEHRRVQKLGREKYYSAFQLQVCKVIRAYGHPSEGAPSHG